MIVLDVMNFLPMKDFFHLLFNVFTDVDCVCVCGCVCVCVCARTRAERRGIRLWNYESFLMYNGTE